MEKNFNNIDDLFKEELGGYTETPPPMVWDALEKRLQGDDKRRVYPYRWLWYFSIVAFVVLLGSSIAWMMGGRSLPAKTAAIAGTKATTPATSGADNANQPATTAINSEMPVAGHTKKGQHTSMNILAYNTNNNRSRRSKHITNSKIHTAQYSRENKTVPGSRPTNDDLYADTDDDQYIVGGTSNRKQNYDVPVASTNLYITKSRSQHNIRVAETDPTETAHENSYGNYTAVSKSAAASVANAHYDIDLDDASAETEPSAHHAARTVHHAQVAKRTNTGIAQNSRVSRTKRQETVVATTKTPKHIATSSVASNQTPDATASVAAVNTKRHGKRHSAVVAPQQPEHGLASVNAARQNDKPASGQNMAADQTATDKKVAGATTSAPTPAALVPAKTEISEKTATKKTAPAVVTPTATSLPVAANAPKSTHRNKAYADQNNKSQSAPVVATNPVATNTEKIGELKSREDETPKTKVVKATKTEVAKTETRVTRPANHSSEPKTPVVAKTKTPAEPKAPVNQYAAGKSVKTIKTPVAKEEAPVIAAKQPIAVKPAKKAERKTKVAKRTPSPVPATVVATSVNEKGKTGAGAKEDNNSEKIVAVKKVAERKTPVQKTTLQPKEVKQDDVAMTTVDKPVATREAKSPKKEASRKTGANSGKTPTPAIVPPVHTYSSSIPKRSVEDESVMIDNLKVSNFEAKESLTANSNELIPGTFKNDNEVDKSKAAGAEAKIEPADSTAKHHFFSKKFEAGVKGGFETGFNARAANKLVIEPYVQYNLSDKFSVLTQPSLKISNVSKMSVGETSSYYDAGNGTYTQTASGAVYLIAYVGTSSVITQFMLRKYRLTYDSIVKSYSVGGTYVEAELPLLLKYNIGKGVSVYGGANAVFSKYTSIRENTNKYNGNFNTMTFLPASVTGNDTLPITANLKLPGTPISQYGGPLYPSQQGTILRLGYMLGFSYEYKKRWLFDALVQQAMVKPNYEAGVNTNAPLSMPYFRLTLGYKLTK